MKRAAVFRVDGSRGRPHDRDGGMREETFGGMGGVEMAVKWDQ